MLSILPPFGLVVPVILTIPGPSPPISAPLFLSHSSLQLLSFPLRSIRASSSFHPRPSASASSSLSQSLEQGIQTGKFSRVRVQRGLSTDPAPRVELKIRVVPRGLPTPSRNSIGDEMEEKEWSSRRRDTATEGKRKGSKRATRGLHEPSYPVH